MNINVGDDSKTTLLKYILNPELAILNPKLEIFPRKLEANKLYNVSEFTPSTKLTASRDPITGEIIDFVEVYVEDAGTATSSMSMNRIPDPRNLDSTSSVLGSTMNYPFWPAGFEKYSFELEAEMHTDDFNVANSELLTIPPGFNEGYTFDYPGDATTNTTINLLETLEKDLHDVQDLFKSKDTNNKTKKSNIIAAPTAELEDFLKSDLSQILDISGAATLSQLHSNHCEWAEMVDISNPVTDFKQKVPDPALTYPFELDIFQKQAILKLEERKYVFVAAHTSAGKTVVAEYAIALSMRHMTRTIYTSPIKALSNQKYQDFKKRFKDVGLITGDLQIDPTASCLIMTTEILRSMLYCGSEITRDIEYVIFDEVHYINDADRGHVWEEVLILLPSHVQIIMLSATVPNTMELAEWVGTTKQQKVYVISTLKRPVPLVHYLYTGE